MGRCDVFRYSGAFMEQVDRPQSARHVGAHRKRNGDGIVYHANEKKKEGAKPRYCCDQIDAVEQRLSFVDLTSED